MSCFWCSPVERPLLSFPLRWNRVERVICRNYVHSIDISYRRTSVGLKHRDDRGLCRSSELQTNLCGVEASEAMRRVCCRSRACGPAKLLWRTVYRRSFRKSFLNALSAKSRLSLRVDRPLHSRHDRCSRRSCGHDRPDIRNRTALKSQKSSCETVLD